jgi:hypothetical protein
MLPAYRKRRYFDGNHSFALNEWLRDFVASISCFYFVSSNT